MVTNRRTVTTEQDDFYPSPEWTVEALLAYEYFGGSILEPACGDGAICEVLRAHGLSNVTALDLHDHGYGTPDCDFLDSPNHFVSGSFDNVITNPPYNIADEFVTTSLYHARHKVAFLVRLAFLEGQSRYNEIFSKHPPARVWVFSERITMYKKYAEDKSGSGTTAYAWVVWDKDHSGPTELGWIRPGFKPKDKKNG